MKAIHAQGDIGAAFGIRLGVGLIKMVKNLNDHLNQFTYNQNNPAKPNEILDIKYSNPDKITGQMKDREQKTKLERLCVPKAYSCSGRT